jgi:hypothetical protein
MPIPPVLTDAFAEERRQMLQDFADLIVYDPDDLLAIWSRHSRLLDAARGVFVVADPRYAKPLLPGDRNFGTTGFLRNWMADTTLLLIQDYRGDREFRYSAPIFCDTNFVSFCGAFLAGRELGANQAGFLETLEFLSPRSHTLNALLYLVENARLVESEHLRNALIAFAMFKADGEAFRTQQANDAKVRADAEHAAENAIQMMKGPDFKLLHGWADNQFRWAKIVLTKAALLGFDQRLRTTEERLYHLLEFLHTQLGRIPDFETYVAYRFFELNTAEPFFNPLQLNAKSLFNSLRAMAWDLAHWRVSFDILMIWSHRESEAAFPIPHFLSFDRRFIRLTEKFRLRGLIYSAGRRRSELMYTRSLLKGVSDVLAPRCYAAFYSQAAIQDRRERATSDEGLDEELVAVETMVTDELREILPQVRRRGSV